jgi:hypothetical protein
MKGRAGKGVVGTAGMVGWLVAGVLVAGCAAQDGGGVRVVAGGSGAAPSHTSQATPSAPGGACPAPAEWEHASAPTAIGGDSRQHT